jgi:hypothetical protein
MPEVKQQGGFSIPYPPEFIYKYRGQSVPNQIIPQQAMFLWERMEYPESGGQLAWFKGVPYPSKGHPYPEAVYAVNVGKRVTMVLLRLLTHWPTVTRLLEAYVSICDMFLPPFVIKERYYSECPMEIMIFIKNLLVTYGIQEPLAMRVAEVVGMMIEYDNAYRLRIEDVMSTTTKEKLLANPVKELRRMLDLANSRENGIGNEIKYGALKKLLRILFWYPKFRRSFKKAVELSEFGRFQYDAIDKYHTLIWSDYNFRGQTLADRMKEYVDFHKGHLPPQLVRQIPKA